MIEVYKQLIETLSQLIQTQNLKPMESNVQSVASGEQRSEKSGGSGKPGSKAFGQSSYSLNTTAIAQRKNKASLREHMIAKKIQEIFAEKNNKMIRTIESTIYEDKLRVYRMKRSNYEDELLDLENERKKIVKRKKNKKEKTKALKANTRQQLRYLVQVLQDTVVHYKALYFENDFYRHKRLLDLSNVGGDSPRARAKMAQEVLNNFFSSPFKDDRRFTIRHLAQLTRDRMAESKNLIDALFFDKVFRLMLSTQDESNVLNALDIVCNLTNHEEHRKRLATGGYYKQIYDAMHISELDDRRVEKLSHMTTLICYHGDMLDQIIEMRLLKFILKLVEPKFPPSVRSNAVHSISMLTYHEKLFDELISSGVIDYIMELCMDPKGDLQVKQFSTLALVHFALSKRSINILIDKGIMGLFNALKEIGDAQIQTNVSWIFLALCNNGITGQQMLYSGITRDMFLVSCNPQFSQIRHLVIAGFAELGRCEIKDEQNVELQETLQKIREKAIVGMHEAFQKGAGHTIDVLLKFSLSSESNFKLTAYWALKDYILLNRDNLVSDLSGVICAFVNGALESSDKVKYECANAISFIITHHLVFGAEEIEEREQCRQKTEADGDKDETEAGYVEGCNYILDALMYLTGSETLQVRSRAFSTLGSLSTYASATEATMSLVQSDIKLPQGMVSKDYYKFIEERITKSREGFRKKYQTESIEKDYAGLYCLLRLAQEPDEPGIEEAASKLRQFYFPDLDLKRGAQNAVRASYDSKADLLSGPRTDSAGGAEEFQTFTDEEKRQLSVNMFNDDLDEREVVLDELNEKFFMFVFKALLFTKNRRILYQLLDVINFYIAHETPYQTEVINPSTILWMLEILDTHRQDKDLCLLAAKTVLKVVDNHQIVFEYQEMAIINQFNKALENIDRPPEEQSPPKAVSEKAPADADAEPTGGDKQADGELEPHGSVEKPPTPTGSERREAKVATSHSSGPVTSARSIKALQEQVLASAERKMKQMAEDGEKRAPRKNIFGHRAATPLKRDENGQLVPDETQPLDTQSELRDALIKSFMVIFTNERSQHLLLNKDIIDIAFDCLENCNLISAEAKRNLARLLSIIFKFPQVQKRLMEEQVVFGICYLLQADKNSFEILHHVIRASTYISLNFNFLNSELSLHVLQALNPLLDTFQSQELASANAMGSSRTLKSQITTAIDGKSDKDNVLFAIANLLKGRGQNSQHFIANDGPRRVMQEILRPDTSHAVMELSLGSIKQIANQKPVFRQLLGRGGETLTLLPTCLKKGFTESDEWHGRTTDLLLFKKIFNHGSNLYDKTHGNEPDPSKVENDQRKKPLNAEQILNIDFKNIDKLKTLEMLEQKEDLSFVMHPLCKIRSHCYFTAASCFSNGFQIDFLLNDCDILGRMVADLKQDTYNDYIFQHLILFMQALKRDKDSIYKLMSEHSQELYDLIGTIQDQTKRVTLAKSVIYLILKAPEHLCSLDPSVFGKLFQMAVEQEDKEIIENVLWLQTSLIELKSSEEQYQMAVELCLQFKSAETYARCVQSDHGPIVLQALKGLTSLAEIAQFKPTILIDLGDTIFPALAAIISQKLGTFSECKDEIESEVVSFLAQITESTAATKDPLTVAGKRRVVQQGFMEHFLTRSSDIKYQFEDESEYLAAENEHLGDEDFQGGDSTDSQDGEAVAIYDSAELSVLKVPGTAHIEALAEANTAAKPNKLVENTMSLAANVSELLETQQELVSGKGQLLMQAMDLLHRLIEVCDETRVDDGEGVDIMTFSNGNRLICKSVSQILLSICSNPQMIEFCMQNQIGEMMVRACRTIDDYDLHSNLYKAMSFFGSSPSPALQRYAVNSQCFNEVLVAADQSKYFRVRRTCGQALDKTSQDLYELNDKVQSRLSRKRKATETLQMLAVQDATP